MLVDRRRGRGRGRSDRPRVGHMTTDEAAEKYADGMVVKESGSGSIRGGFRVRDKGGFLANRAQRNESFKIDVTPSADLSLQEKVHSDGSTPPFSRDSNVTFSGDPKPSSSRDRPMVAHFEIQSDALTPVSPALGLENQLLAPRQARSFSPPPVIRASFPLSPSLRTDGANPSHSMIVEHVSTMLQADPPDTYVDDAEGSLEDCGDEMTDGDEPDDLMTLGQCQSEARREVLIRKGSQASMPSLKKGKVEPAGKGV